MVQLNGLGIYVRCLADDLLVTVYDCAMPLRLFSVGYDLAFKHLIAMGGKVAEHLGDFICLIVMKQAFRKWLENDGEFL